jgi:iron(III) transport system substrate-binding protein
MTFLYLQQKEPVMNETKKLKFWALGATALLGASVAGCSPLGAASGGNESSAEASVYEKVQAMPEGERMDALVKAAKEEGKATVYLRSDVAFQRIKDAFEAKYGIELEILNPGLPPVVYQQISEGEAAGRQQADVVETFNYELELVYPEANLTANMPDFLKAAAPDPELAADHSIESFQYAFIPVWNKNEIKGGDVPTSLQDFAKPIWKNKIVLPKGDFFWSWYRATFEELTKNQGMSVPDFEKLMTGIVANASITASSNPAAQGIASGEYKGGPNVNMSSAQKLMPAAPIAYQPTPSPAVTVPVGVSLLKNAPHPNAAMLFTDWYLTEGSDILVNEAFIEQNPNETDLKGVKIIRDDLNDMTKADMDEWRMAFENLVTGKTPILPESVRGN